MSATTATAPTVARTTLRRLPPLPGHLVSWPIDPPTPTGQAMLDLEPPCAPEPPTVERSAPDRRRERAMRARAARFAMAFVETVAGDRPVTQLAGWVSQEVYESMSTLATAASRTSDSVGRARTERPRLLSLHTSHPATNAVEVCGHIRHGVRSRAIALRLELSRGRWICTALDIG